MGDDVTEVHVRGVGRETTSAVVVVVTGAHHPVQEPGHGEGLTVRGGTGEGVGVTEGVIEGLRKGGGKEWTEEGRGEVGVAGRTGGMIGRETHGNQSFHAFFMYHMSAVQPHLRSQQSTHLALRSIQHTFKSIRFCAHQTPFCILLHHALLADYMFATSLIH